MQNSTKLQQTSLALYTANRGLFILDSNNVAAPTGMATKVDLIRQEFAEAIHEEFVVFTPEILVNIIQDMAAEHYLTGPSLGYSDKPYNDFEVGLYIGRVLAYAHSSQIT